MQLLCRTSSTFLSGSLGAVSLKGSGVTKFYLQGQADSLALDLSGVSNAESAINSGNWPFITLQQVDERVVHCCISLASTC